jgi:hypothetical protein
MKPTIQNALPCAVFGHNYKMAKRNSNHTTELICTNCNAIVHTDVKGNFETSSISNKDIQSSLRQLFHLNLRISRSIPTT